MKFVTTLFVSVLLTSALAVTVPERVCPDRCHPHRPLAVQQCEHHIITPLCVVKSCANGFSCSLPANSFLVANIALSNVELLMEYSWAADRRDLDTSTRFHGANVGWSCNNPSEYLKWLGDNTSYGGSEYAVVDFEQARIDGVWTDATTVTANAGWHGSNQQGEAQLRVWLRGKGSDDLQAGGDSPSVVIHPGVQINCSPHHVGNVKIVRGEKLTRITVEQA